MDDLAICMKDPQAFCDTQTTSSSKELDHSAIILVVDKPEMKMELLLQIQGNMLTRFFSPKKTRTPLVAGDHPENGLSEFCDQDQIKQYQTIVGQLFWLTRLGQFDIAVHVMTMSRFRQQPRVAHLERLKRIIGYLVNFSHGSLRFRAHEPDYSNLPHKEYDWQRTVYSGAKEEVPHDIPEPKGKHVATATFVDANLHHDQVTGRAVAACVHVVKATPSHWHTKRQATDFLI